MPVVAVIGSAGLPAQYGGFETFAENLVSHLDEQYEFIVYCSAPEYQEHPPSFGNARLKYLPLHANGVQSISYDILSMIHAAPRADILLVLGVSGCVFLPFIKLFSRKKIVVHLDGIEWRRAKWNRLARAFLKISEYAAVRFADALIADNAAIRRYVFRRYGKDCVSAGYGGDHAVANLSDEQVERISAVPFDRYALSICRIEPENNIHLILEAFADAGTLPLVIVGNWSSSRWGSRVRARFEDMPGILLLDPIFDVEALHSLRVNAELYVHGHSAGGTNPSLVEAMYLGMPVAAFDVNYNRVTTHNRAEYFNDVASLRLILSELDERSLTEMAAALKDIAREHYTWATIADQYASMFESLLALEHGLTLDEERHKHPAIIDAANCTGCGQCLPACPTDAIVGAVNFTHRVDTDKCIGCTLCLAHCDIDCISIEAPDVDESIPIPEQQPPLVAAG